MDFLFAIPSFIFHLISTLFSWVFSVISGMVGIVVWPFKLVWGLLMGVGKTLISIILLPTLLFSHPGDISTAQPVVGKTAAIAQPVVEKTAAIPNTYYLEQIYNDINELERAGREMDRLRNSYDLSDLKQCGDKMREYQDQVADLIDMTATLPIQYKITLGAAATRLNSCVSCSTSAEKQCDLVLQELSDYQSMINEQ